MSFQQILDDVIELADNARNEDTEPRKKFNIKPGFRITPLLKDNSNFYLADRSQERQLQKYLESLPEYAVFRIESLMYFGCDDRDDLKELRAWLEENRSTREETITAIIRTELALSGYLKRGLQGAKTNSVSLDNLP